jgi:hypothetical protein
MENPGQQPGAPKTRGEFQAAVAAALKNIDWRRHSETDLATDVWPIVEQMMEGEAGAVALLREIREDATHCPFCQRVECADDCRLLAVLRPRPGVSRGSGKR